MFISGLNVIVAVYCFVKPRLFRELFVIMTCGLHRIHRSHQYLVTLMVFSKHRLTPITPTLKHDNTHRFPVLVLLIYNF